MIRTKTMMPTAMAIPTRGPPLSGRGRMCRHCDRPRAAFRAAVIRRRKRARSRPSGADVGSVPERTHDGGISGRRDRRRPRPARLFHPTEPILVAAGPARQRRLRVDVVLTSDRNHRREHRRPTSPRNRARCRRVRRRMPSARSTSGSSPIDAPLRNSFCACDERGEPGRHARRPATDPRARSFLICSQLVTTSLGVARPRRRRTRADGGERAWRARRARRRRR